ncbi:ABC transporter permease [Streptomyces alfalfae]|uniref:Peptide ABC transporter permease n=1 Tax=Streptomyces alfalfae TaxID=1642299 RepID=A0ABM6GR56_9ACTN|nr:ABC transporter permease [Streptomyces alfalfae]APY85914.1 peptide ABC transporter permease [Streptomyces alfalfae]AYA16278.1 ABC transporter permease [Streptomyces fradiae]RXX38263.1 ABC transporter permease [Streptomyces alfalfae]RZN00969.1 ABC transporter permease [Streptomyces alfalfae]
MAATTARRTTAETGWSTPLGPWGTLLVRRLAGLIAVAITLVAGTFLMVQLIPGDPARVVAGAEATPVDVERARHDLGLDQPLLTRFGTYTGGLLRGHMGTSFQTQEPVAEIIGDRLPFTTEIALLSVLVVLVLAVPIGLAVAARGSRRTDGSFTFVTGTVGATPEYIIGTLLVLGFAIELGWLPAAGAETVSSMVLPVAALVLPATCVMARIVRREAEHVLAQDYMRTARGRRLPPLRLYARHALPNLLTATLTLGGLILAGLLGGTVVVESVFAWPGIGQRVVEALLVRDYPVIQGCVLILGLLAALLNLLVDVVLALLDPRTLAGKGGH